MRSDEMKGAPTKRIAWIASYPKSGNTKFRMMVNSYFGGGHVDINSPSFASVGDNLEYWHQMCAPCPLDKLDEFSTICVRIASFNHLLYWINRDPVFVKTHNANVVIGGIPLMPAPFTKVALYIVRDPRDVVLSYSDYFGVELEEVIHRMEQDNNIIGDEGHVSHYILSWSLHVKSWTEQKAFPVLAIKFEDLISTPGPVFKSALEFSGVTVDDSLVEKAVEATTFNALRDQEKKNGFKENLGKGQKFFRRGKSGLWKKELDPKLAQRILDKHGPMMEKFGYI